MTQPFASVVTSYHAESGSSLPSFVHLKKVKTADSTHPDVQPSIPGQEVSTMSIVNLSLDGKAENSGCRRTVRVVHSGGTVWLDARQDQCPRGQSGPRIGPETGPEVSLGVVGSRR